MANEDLVDATLDELGHYIRLAQTSTVGDPTGRSVACREELFSRDHWYCDHDEIVTPMENCAVCGRHYTYITAPENEDV